MIEDPKAWYEKNWNTYDLLTKYVKNVIENIFSSKNISYVQIASRTKSIESFCSKMNKKSYASQKDNTDFSGIRIILYLESDVARVCQEIDNAFRVHTELSGDKKELLGEDRVGYQSVHKVCDIGPTRENLSECNLYKGLRFEIQIRTVLQHAWAEIEHDRRYKFNGVLPKELKRRLSIVAGILELADKEFDTIAKEIDMHNKKVENSDLDELLSLDLDAASIKKYLSVRLGRSDMLSLNVKLNDNESEIAAELIQFGLKKISDFDEIIDKTFINTFISSCVSSVDSSIIENRNALGLIRYALLFFDMERYMEKSWTNDWTAVGDDLRILLLKKYDEQTYNAFLKKYKLNGDYTKAV